MRAHALSAWLEKREFDHWSKGQHKISPQSFFEKHARGEAILLDIRYPEEIEYLQIPSALQIPLKELPARLNEIPRDKIVATFCSGGGRASIAYAYLQAEGFENVRVFQGGYPQFVAEIMPGKIHKLAKIKPSK
jgi:rhodanese-related sulfurtransferase